jgi:hypothetical protein
MMTVKEFMEKTTGVDEYAIEGKEIYTVYHPIEKEKAIEKYGERKIVSIHFDVGYYDDVCVEIEIE